MAFLQESTVAGDIVVAGEVIESGSTPPSGTIDLASTDELPEGSVNRYFTNARVHSAIAAGNNITFNVSGGILTINGQPGYVSADFDNDFAAKTTDDLTEGATNLYYDSSLFDVDFNAKSTDDVSEGSVNQYFTALRAVNAIESETSLSLSEVVFGDLTVSDKLIDVTSLNQDLQILTNGGIIETNTSIVPDADIAYDLGSPTRQWRDVYVGPGSLFVDGKKVLESDEGTINVRTDDNQNLAIRTLGTGELELISDQAIQMKGVLQISAGNNVTSSDGNDIVFANGISFSNGVGIDASAIVSGNIDTSRFPQISSIQGTDSDTFSIDEDETDHITLRSNGNTLEIRTADNANFANLTAEDLTVNGSLTSVELTELAVNDNKILLNDNVTSPIAGLSGIEVNRGSQANAELKWDEAGSEWVAGLAGGVDPIALENGAVTFSTVTWTGGNSTEANTAYDRSVTGLSGDGNSQLTVQREGTNLTLDLDHSHGFADLPISSGDVSNWDTAYDERITGFTGSGNGNVTLVKPDVANLTLDLSHTHGYADLPMSAGDISNGNIGFDRSPTGLSVSGANGNGTLTVTIDREDSPSLQSSTNLSHSHGFGDLPISSSDASEWDTAYDRSIVSASGNGNGTLTLTREDNTTVTTSLGHNHSAGEITSGTFSTSRIPNLSANKITSGTLSTARLPTLSSGDVDFADQSLNTSNSPIFSTLTLNGNLVFRRNNNIIAQWRVTERFGTGSNDTFELNLRDIADGSNLAEPLRFRIDGTRQISAAGGFEWLFGEDVQMNGDLDVGGVGIFQNRLELNSSTFNDHIRINVTGNPIGITQTTTNNDALAITWQSGSDYDSDNRLWISPNNYITFGSSSVDNETDILEIRNKLEVGGDLDVSGDITGSNLNISNWDTAYDRSPTGLSVSASGRTVTVTLNRQGVSNLSSNNTFGTFGTGDVNFTNQALSTTSNVRFNRIGIGKSSTTGFSIDATDDIRTEGDVIAFSSSDMNLKNNIKPIENAIDKIARLGGYEFDWKDGLNYTGHSYGVMAQEVEKIFPELVREHRAGHKQVEYSKLIPVMLQAIKEQQAQIDALQAA